MIYGSPRLVFAGNADLCEFPPCGTIYELILIENLHHEGGLQGPVEEGIVRRITYIGSLQMVQPVVPPEKNPTSPGQTNDNGIDPTNLGIASGEVSFTTIKGLDLDEIHRQLAASNDSFLTGAPFETLHDVTFGPAETFSLPDNKIATRTDLGSANNPATIEQILANPDQMIQPGTFYVLNGKVQEMKATNFAQTRAWLAGKIGIPADGSDPGNPVSAAEIAQNPEKFSERIRKGEDIYYYVTKTPHTVQEVGSKNPEEVADYLARQEGISLSGFPGRTYSQD